MNRFIAIALLLILNACSFRSDIPLSINDIDTISVYKRYQDSLIQVAESQLIDTQEFYFQPLAEDSVVIQSHTNNGKWTICKGTFKLKENARRRYNDVSKSQLKTYVLKRNDLIYITTGLFENKDLADAYIEKNAYPEDEDYAMKILTGDQFMLSFPE